MINRLIQLALILKTSELMHAYNFHQRTEGCFDVYTADENGNPYNFTIIKEHNRWVMHDGSFLPDWIRQTENELLCAFTGAETADLIFPGCDN